LFAECIKGYLAAQKLGTYENADGVPIVKKDHDGYQWWIKWGR
jgi:hypothetical protein